MKLLDSLKSDSADTTNDGDQSEGGDGAGGDNRDGIGQHQKHSYELDSIGSSQFQTLPPRTAKIQPMQGPMLRQRLKLSWIRGSSADNSYIGELANVNGGQISQLSNRELRQMAETQGKGYLGAGVDNFSGRASSRGATSELGVNQAQLQRKKGGSLEVDMSSENFFTHKKAQKLVYLRA